jgi:glycosyltransferase involved in cell wall biosynthesis
MKLTLVSNYINHHQIPVSNELYNKLGDDYCFIQTQPMEEERVKMGWDCDVNKIPYLKLFYEEPDKCRKLIMDSDIVIFGGVEDESYIKPRLDAGKIVIRYSERLYKEGQWKSISPRGRKKKYEDHTQYADKDVYLLCSGAYVASDFNIVHAYPNKKYTWGYFPKTINYDIDELLAKKQHDKTRLLWAGRFINWKHPEYAIKVAKYLKDKGATFHLDMVGSGELDSELKKLTTDYKLEENVTFQGSMPPEKVRGFMEEANIFMFTSNYLEGWGAVLNESMNSACAVVAGHGIGAVPYLLRHGENGLVYRNEDFNEFKNQVLTLATNRDLQIKLGTNAYNTIAYEWSNKEAADRLYSFCSNLMEKKISTYPSGPLSPAPLISPRMGYKYTHRK